MHCTGQTSTQARSFTSMHASVMMATPGMTHLSVIGGLSRLAPRTSGHPNIGCAAGVSSGAVTAGGQPCEQRHDTTAEPPPGSRTSVDTRSRRDQLRQGGLHVLRTEVEHPHAVTPMTETHLRPHAAQGLDGTRPILRPTGRRLEWGRIASGEMTPTSETPDGRGGDDRAQPVPAVIGVQPHSIEQHDMVPSRRVADEIGGQAGSVGTGLDIDPRPRDAVGELADVPARLEGEHQDMRVPDLLPDIAGGAIEDDGDRPALDGAGGRPGAERDPLLEPIRQHEFAGHRSRPMACPVQCRFGLFMSTATVPSASDVIPTASHPWVPSPLSAATDAETPGAGDGASKAGRATMRYSHGTMAPLPSRGSQPAHSAVEAQPGSGAAPLIGKA